MPAVVAFNLRAVQLGFPMRIDFEGNIYMAGSSTFIGNIRIA